MRSSSTNNTSRTSIWDKRIACAIDHAAAAAAARIATFISGEFGLLSPREKIYSCDSPALSRRWIGSVSYTTWRLALSLLNTHQILTNYIITNSFKNKLKISSLTPEISKVDKWTSQAISPSRDSLKFLNAFNKFPPRPLSYKVAQPNLLIE